MPRSFRAILPLLLLALAATGCREATSSLNQVTLDGLLQQSIAHATFRGALSSTGQLALLQGTDRYTVFAPTDQAFDKLPEATRQAIFADPAKLRALVQYHLVAGLETGDELTNGRQLTTVEGSSVTITRGSGTLKVNDANVVQPNLGAVNGVIHVIDSVLIPPGLL